MPAFFFNHPVPHEEWVTVGQKEWRKLPGCTSYHQLRTWVARGAVTYDHRGRKRRRRLCLPTFRMNGRKRTTLAAYKWWIEQQNGN